MNNQPKKDKEDVKKGPVIPAGTEQETGLTRGETEKQDAPKPVNPQNPQTKDDLTQND